MGDSSFSPYFFFFINLYQVSSKKKKINFGKCKHYLLFKLV